MTSLVGFKTCVRKAWAMGEPVEFALVHPHDWFDMKDDTCHWPDGGPPTIGIRVGREQRHITIIVDYTRPVGQAIFMSRKQFDEIMAVVSEFPDAEELKL